MQINAEPVILSAVGEQHDVDLAPHATPRSISLSGGSRVQVDGIGEGGTAFVEVFAHQGPLKGGQRHKVANDALKLITLGREHPGARLIIAFADQEAADSVRGKSWLAQALRSGGVEVLVAEIDPALRALIRAEQGRQFMAHPPPQDS